MADHITLSLLLAGDLEEGSVDAVRLADPRHELRGRRRNPPVRSTKVPGVDAAFARLEALLGEDPEPAPDDLSTLTGARAALRSASYAAMVSAHNLADVDESLVLELEADLDAQLARLDAARKVRRALGGA